MRDILLWPQSAWRHNLATDFLLWRWLLCCWLVLRQCCSIPLALWDQLCMHNIERYPPIVALCWLQGGLTLVIQVLGVPILVLWSHSWGGSIGGGIAGVGLG